MAQREVIHRRFWRHVNKSARCWEWTGCTQANGYGRVGTGVGRRVDFTHRVSWRLAFGEIPDGLFVCHHCDNRRCVRPDHLFLGTLQENADDCRLKGRRDRPQGEQHPRAKLTANAVLAIRAVSVPDLRTAQAIAARFGVTPATIYSIRARRSWRHVA